jgi:WD40 repeat protein
MDTTNASLGVRVYRALSAERSVRPNKAVTAQLDVAPHQLLTTRRLDASGTFLGAHGARALLDVLHAQQQIAALDVAKNGIDTEAVTHLVAVAARHASLTSISLAHNALSTPAARTLWELARGARHIQHIDLEGTGLTDEWRARIAKQLAVNEEFHTVGFDRSELARSDLQWETVFVFVWAGPGMVRYADMLADDVLPALNSFFSTWRLRVVPLVHCEASLTPETVAEHLRLCEDRNNNFLPWVICFGGVEVPPFWSAFLTDTVLRLRRPDVPPLHDKHGNTRAPVRPVVRPALVYQAPMPLQDALDMTPDEIHRNATYDALRAHDAVNWCGVRSDDELLLRMRMDVFTKMAAVYATTRVAPPSAMADGVNADDHGKFFVDLDRRMGLRMRLPSIGPHARPGELDAVLRYCERPASGAAFPLLLYGGAGAGRSAVLAHAAERLQQRAAAGERVVPYFVKEVPSVVTFLVYVCRVFGGLTTLPDDHHGSLDILQWAAHNAIASFPAGRPRTTLLIANADMLDYVCLKGATQPLWLPLSFPDNVRVVCSIATESAFLRHMRSREQQPYDVLMRRLPRDVFSQHLLKHMARRGIAVAGLGDEIRSAEFHRADSEGVVLEPTSCPGAVFVKEDSDRVLFATLLPSLLEVSGAHLMQSAEEVRRFILAEVPQTSGEVVHALLRFLETRYAPALVRDVVASVCCTRVSVPELQLFVESFFEHPRFAAVPLMVHMVALHLLRISDEGIVLPVHHVVERALLLYYPATAVDRCRSRIASFHMDAVRRRRGDFARSFALLPDLLLHAGQTTALGELLLDVVLLDDLVRTRPGIQVVVFDAYWRAVHTIDHLSEIMIDGRFGRQLVHHRGKGRLMRALRYFAHCRSNVWQSAIAMKRDSPLYNASLQVTSVPYPSVKLINRTYAEKTSVWRLHPALPTVGLRHCSLLAPIFAVCSEDSVVSIYDAETGALVTRANDLVVAVANADEAPSPLLGATVCTPTRVLCIAHDSLTVWNIDDNTRRVYSGVTASLRQNAVSGDGAAVIAVDVETRDVTIMDLSRGTTLSRLPVASDVVKEAHFVGVDSVLVVAPFGAQLCKPSGDVVDLAVDTAQSIRSVQQSADGKWLAACAGTRAFLWSHLGDLLHTVDHVVSPVVDVAFHPNGSLFLTLAQDGHISVWLTLTGQRHRDLAAGVGVGEAEFACFTPDGTKLVARCGTKLRMWDGTTFEDLGGVVAHDGVVRYVCVDNETMVTVCDAGGSKVWNLKKGFPSLSHMHLSSDESADIINSGYVAVCPIRLMALSPLGDVLAVLTERRTLKLFGLQLARSTAPLRQQIRDVTSTIVFHGSGDLLYMSGQRTLNVRAPDGATKTVALAASIEQPTEWLLATAPTTGYDAIVCCANYPIGCVMAVYDAATLQLKVQFVGHARPALALVLAHDALITASGDRTVCAWSLLSNALRCDYAHGSDVTAMALLPGRRNLMIADSEGVLTTLGLIGDGFTVLRTVHVGTTVCTITPLTTKLLSLSNNSRCMFIFDVAAGRCVNTIEAAGTAGSITAIAASAVLPPAAASQLVMQPSLGATSSTFVSTAMVPMAKNFFAFFGTEKGYVEVYQVLGL